ncbi:MAG: HIT family protein [Wenzhouxiangellaceae bacterium]|nr:HIT family protein [Wenzhouxiangellaceae bacterium]
MNKTLEKFGYPDNVLFETRHWVVLLRPEQVTLGALVVGSKTDATAFGQLDAAAFEDLAHVVQRIEPALLEQFNYQKMNYLMLMMVDPHVHFHALPRYAVPPEFDGVRFIDAGWPGPPDLGAPTALESEVFAHLRATLRAELGTTSRTAHAHY